MKPRNRDSGTVRRVGREIVESEAKVIALADISRRESESGQRMSVRFIGPAVATVLVTVVSSETAISQRSVPSTEVRESRISVGNAAIYARTIGQGRPMIVLHGGPDFDQAYLLPEFDRYADAFRLIYYDQRGRGKSARGVEPQDVSLGTEIDDLDKVREHFQLTAPVLLGHSWGAVLALEYALRHPTRVSHLILMNPAPVSVADVGVLRKAYMAQLGADMEKQKEIFSSAAYQSGDPVAVAARYRIHFKHGLTRPADYERLMTRMAAAFSDQGAAGIVKARAVEDRLMRETWASASYDLLPKLRNLRIPTLVIVGVDDFIPVEIAARIARAIPDARLVSIRACGHFAYLECPAEARAAVDGFLQK